MMGHENCAHVSLGKNTSAEIAGISPIEIRNLFSLRNKAVIHVLQFFSDSHLHPALRVITTPIRNTAFLLVDSMMDGPELTVALRHLLDSQNAFIRHYQVTHNFEAKGK